MGRLVDMHELQESLQSKTEADRSSGASWIRRKNPVLYKKVDVREQKCWDCHMNYLGGIPIHPAGMFGKSCPFKKCLQLCLGTWCNAFSRKMIIKEFNLNQEWDKETELH